MKIEPTFVGVSKNNEIEISFNHSMKMIEITQDDLLIEVTSSFRIFYSWTAYFSNSETLLIKVTTSSIFEGGEEVKVSFINYKVFRADIGG